MNKTIIILSLAFSLLGLSTAKADEFIIPASSYSLQSTAGIFTDISNLEGTIELGKDLPAGTALKNGFFVHDATTPFVTHTADKTKTDPGFELGFEFNLCGKKMTHFTICASGGIHFSATENVIQAQSSAWFTTNQTYENLVTMGVWDAAGTQNSMVSIADKAPVMYRIDGEAGAKTLTVQYTYALGADEWTFQIKAYEATGDIELVVGDLAKTQVGDKNYRLTLALVENGAMSIANDPFKALSLSMTSHKVAVQQTAASAGDWTKFSIHIGSSLANTNAMYITAAAGPERGRTLTIAAPNTCAEKAAQLPDFYSFALNTISKTAFSGTIAVDKTKITPAELTAAGTMLVVFSTKETPDYTLSNGTWYQSGTELGSNSRVIANQKPGYYIMDGSSISQFNDFKISADGLTEGTRYYLHVYAMDYQCLGAPVYSDLCKTFSFTSSIDLPKSLATGLPKTTAIPVTVQSAGEGYGVVLLKSPNTNPVNLSGKLEAGQKIGDVEVLTVINSAAETNFDAPFEPGEGAYILAVSATGLDGDSPVYAADFLSEPVRAAYDGLHSFDDFSKEPYTYGGPDEYRRLPFGWHRENAFPKGMSNLAFGLGFISEGDPICLTSSFPNSDSEAGIIVAPDFYADVVTPAFACPRNKKKIAVTFHTSYLMSAGLGEPSRYTPGETDIVRIEYSVDGGAWQLAAEFRGDDPEFPQLNAQGQYALNTVISSLTPGNIIRLRYSYRSPNESATVSNRIHAINIVDGKDCERPISVVIVDSLSTDDRLTLRWLDNNLPGAPNFVIAYQATGDETWRYTRVAAPAGSDLETPIDGNLSNLKAGTMYHAKVAALCDTRDTSFYTEPLTTRTAFALPYTESMARTGSGTAAQTPFDRGVQTYSGAIGGQLTETTAAQTGWSQSQTSSPYNVAHAVSVGDFVSNAWLMLPAVHIRETGDFTPKSVSFTLSSFDSGKTKGAKPNFDDTKLHVLASKDGRFTQSTIIKTFPADSLALDDARKTIDLTDYEGYVKIAFVFECPTGSQTAGKNEQVEERPEPWYIELSQLTVNYDVDMCFPIKNLYRELDASSVPMEWDASATAVEYGIFWHEDGVDHYTDSAFTKETRFTITGLKESTLYSATVIAYCNADRSLFSEPETTWFTTLQSCHTPQGFHVDGITLSGADFISTSDQPDYMTQRLVYLTPENSDETLIFVQASDTLRLHTLLEKTAYLASTRAICSTDTSAMSDTVRFVTDLTATEAVAQLNGLFTIRTQNGHIHIRNLNSLLVRNVTVYNLNGVKLAGFRTDSRDDLELPVNARHLLIFVRLQTEQGTAVYKVYLQ